MVGDPLSPRRSARARVLRFHLPLTDVLQLFQALTHGRQDLGVVGADLLRARLDSSISSTRCRTRRSSLIRLLRFLSRRCVVLPSARRLEIGQFFRQEEQAIIQAPLNGFHLYIEQPPHIDLAHALTAHQTKHLALLVGELLSFIQHTHSVRAERRPTALRRQRLLLSPRGRRTGSGPLPESGSSGKSRRPFPQRLRQSLELPVRGGFCS
jgi:hypothetical protein